jgi:hypothetical protein
MLLWPIINTFFVVLVGYDSDVTKAIRKLSQKRWRQLSTGTSTIDLGGVPSIVTPTGNRRFNKKNINLKRPISNSQSDPEMQMFDDTDILNSRPNSNINECNECNDSYDLSLVHIERWKSRLSSAEQQIHEQVGYNDEEDKSRRKSFPNFHRPTPSASYDTDHTLT